MAKKKRKKRERRAAPPPQDTQKPSARSERKEAARRERERQIRLYRRRRLLKRAALVGLVLGAIAAIVIPLVLSARESSRRREEAQVIAGRIGCGDVEEQPDEGRAHSQQPQPFGSVPATSGSHSAQTLPSEISVYDDPFDLSLEWRAVHNLEHGWVFMYYQPEGDGALPQEIVDALADLAEAEDEVGLAPYPNLPEGENLVFVSWTRAQRCDVSGGADDVVTVAESYIDEFRNSGLAPESAA